MNLTDEWNELFQTDRQIYLYGAGDVAEFIAKMALQVGMSDRIQGILVSKKDAKTPETVEGIPVLEAGSVEDKDAIVLVAVSRKWSEEIRSCAQRLGFSDVRDGFRYLHVYDEATALDEQARERLAVLDEQGNGLDVLKQKLSIMYGEKQMFSGKGCFYQSLPLLGIEGERPTDVRIQTYGLNELVEGKTVIDIGCNTGFLDIMIGEKAKSVCGVEYNQSLVDIANEVISFLDRSNVMVCQGDFLTYQTQETFDVVFLFAVHGWLDCKAEDGAEKIISLLKPNGSIVFESLAWDKGDPLYIQYGESFEKMGMTKIRQGEICDDGKTHRHWCVYTRGMK